LASLEMSHSGLVTVVHEMFHNGDDLNFFRPVMPRLRENSCSLKIVEI